MCPSDRTYDSIRQLPIIRPSTRSLQRVNPVNKIFLILAISLISTNSISQDLIKIYQLALKHDAEIQIAESIYQAALEAVPLAGSVNRPQINFSAHRSFRESELSSTGSNTNNSYGYGLSLSQNIYNADNFSSVDVAEANLKTAEANLDASRQALIIRVSESYFEILAAEDFVDFAIAEQTAITRQLEQAQKRYEVGLIAITDVREAQASFDSAVAQLLLAENLLENAYQALQVIIVESTTEELARPDDSLVLGLPEPADSNHWVELAKQSNPVLLAAISNQQAADHERRRQSSSRHPRVDFLANFNDTNINDEGIGNYDQEDLSFSFQMNIPLYNGGRLSALRLQAESNYQSAQNNVLLQRRLTTQQTRIAYLGILSGISQVKALKQALASSTTALEATEAGFEVGTRTSVDVLVSLRGTYASRREYAQARYDYLVNSLKLKQAAGVLNADDLHGINRWLN
ncbi:MAG: outer membrane protein [Gammaproteobacteria bacterium]